MRSGKQLRGWRTAWRTASNSLQIGCLAADLKAVGPERGPWVRIPPPPLIQAARRGRRQAPLKCRSFLDRRIRPLKSSGPPKSIGFYTRWRTDWRTAARQPRYDEDNLKDVEEPRSVTPEVAGSSPVAPFSKYVQNSLSGCLDRHECAGTQPHRLLPRAELDGRGPLARASIVVRIVRVAAGDSDVERRSRVDRLAQAFSASRSSARERSVRAATVGAREGMNDRRNEVDRSSRKCGRD